MNHYAKLIRELQEPRIMDQIAGLYGTRNGICVSQLARYTRILKRHEEAFSASDGVWLISAPGRTEIGGNHTDHNRGRVLTAAVNLDTLAAVSDREDRVVHLNSEGYAPRTVDLSDLTIHPEETGTTAALIRGVAARMAEMGYQIGGFDAAVTSTVASGSGLSSSAAFEVLISAVIMELFNQGGSLPVEVQARICQYAENEYFGKPSGLLDQMASAAGGLTAVDFKHDEPLVKRMSYDFSAKGYTLAVVGTGGSHADLTDCYAAIPAEMKQVAACFHEEYLRPVRYEEFLQALPTLYGKVPDRALLRAFHFYTENQRVTREVEALKNDRLDDFLAEVIASGRSSFMYLQNIYAKPESQSLSLALAMAEQLLAGKGAWRIHGGGFAGTTLNFVPTEELDHFRSQMEAVFGAGCCHALDIRPVGSAVLRF